MLKKAWDCSKRKIVFSKGSKEEDRELWLLGEGEGKWKIGNEFLLVSKISKRSCAKRDGSRNETFPKRGDRVSFMVKLWNQSNLEKPG